MTKRMGTVKRDEVISLHQAGLTYAEIGRKFGLTRERIRQIAKGTIVIKKKLVLDDSDTFLTISQAAELLNVHENTIRRWCNKGVLETYRLGSRRDRRLKQGDIRKLLQKS